MNFYRVNLVAGKFLLAQLFGDIFHQTLVLDVKIIVAGLVVEVNVRFDCHVKIHLVVGAHPLGINPQS